MIAILGFIGILVLGFCHPWLNWLGCASLGIYRLFPR